MSIFGLPTGLDEIAHFTLPRAQTWGGQNDPGYKDQVRRAAALSREDVVPFEWFAFCIRCVVSETRGRWQQQVPDVENIPKLIVDAFTDLLYPDDNLYHVRGIQVEAEWGLDDQERAEIWIFGKSEGV